MSTLALSCIANHRFDDRTVAHFAAQNIFPLTAPDALFDNDVDKYDRLLERELFFFQLSYMMLYQKKIASAGTSASLFSEPKLRM